MNVGSKLVNFADALTLGIPGYFIKTGYRFCKRNLLTQVVDFERNEYSLLIQQALLKLEREKAKLEDRCKKIDEQISQLDSVAGKDIDFLKSNPLVKKLLREAQITINSSQDFFSRLPYARSTRSTLPPFYQQQRANYQQQSDFEFADDRLETTPETEQVVDDEIYSLTEALEKKINEKKFIGDSNLKDAQWENLEARAVAIADVIHGLQTEQNFNEGQLQQAINALPINLKNEVIAALQKLQEMQREMAERSVHQTQPAAAQRLPGQMQQPARQ
jgi:hypothetical protein